MKPGTAKAILKGKGNFTGTLTMEFYIIKCPVTAISAKLSFSTATYSGKAIKPAVTVTNGDVTLIKGKDYTLEYSDNVNAGTGKVIITGKGYYYDSVTLTFTISPYEISDAKLEYDTAVYTGEPITPGVTVKHGKLVLVEGMDYKVTYKNNVKKGTATVTVTCMGNYSGTVKKTFTITK